MKGIREIHPVLIFSTHQDRPMVVTNVSEREWYGFVNHYSGCMYWSKRTGKARGTSMKFPSYNMKESDRLAFLKHLPEHERYLLGDEE